MESNNNDGSSSGLISYYHPQLHHQTPPSPPPPPPPPAAAATPTNGVAVSNSNAGSILYPHSVPSSAVSSSLEGVKRKRGRPRKYGTPEQAAAAKRLSASASSSSPRTRDSASAAGSGLLAASGSSAYSSKRSQLAGLGNVGQSFSPHIITVGAGEDVNQKIMIFMQQSQRDICIISASGSVSNASLRQPATSGGSITYEGHFDILSLSGSYIRTENGGKTGGLGVCLSSSDGQIIGGGISGPLTAAGTIQIIVGTFLTDSKKDNRGDAASVVKLSPPANPMSMPGLNFRSPVDSSHQIGVGSQFMVQHPHPSMQLTPPHSMEWRGNTGHHGLHQSPENGDYDHHISD